MHHRGGEDRGIARRRATCIVLILTLFALGACGGDDASDSSAAPAAPSEAELSAHEQDIYDQQKGVCKLEAQHNTIEYREQNGAKDPDRYAAYAAEHGFYLVRSEAERDAAIEGCLAGLP